MKQLIAAVLITGMAFSTFAQTATTTTTTTKETKTTKTQLKDHVCTSACKDGKHVYAHGEKGHKCSKDCKKS